MEPGTQATSIDSSGTPCSFSVATAPSKSLRVTDSFQRATTIAKRVEGERGVTGMRLGMFVNIPDRSRTVFVAPRTLQLVMLGQDGQAIYCSFTLIKNSAFVLVLRRRLTSKSIASGPFISFRTRRRR